jgi:hypothetical protein
MSWMMWVGVDLESEIEIERLKAHQPTEMGNLRLDPSPSRIQLVSCRYHLSHISLTSLSLSPLHPTPLGRITPHTRRVDAPGTST